MVTTRGNSHTVLGAELVDQPLRVVCLLDDSLLVVLTDGTAEFVIVHSRTVLAHAPKLGDAGRVFDLEDALTAVQPADAVAIATGLQKQLPEELP